MNKIYLFLTALVSIIWSLSATAEYKSYAAIINDTDQTARFKCEITFENGSKVVVDMAISPHDYFIRRFDNKFKINIEHLNGNQVYSNLGNGEFLGDEGMFHVHLKPNGNYGGGLGTFESFGMMIRGELRGMLIAPMNSGCHADAKQE